MRDLLVSAIQPDTNPKRKRGKTDILAYAWGWYWIRTTSAQAGKASLLANQGLLWYNCITFEDIRLMPQT
jgi:hypothetical protein